MQSRYILAFDPSGNYKEGQGTTGWCLFDTETKKIAKYGSISASKFESQQAYWDAHINLLDALAGYGPEIVMEDYLLYCNRATTQINSRMETPQLIGVIKYECYKRGIQLKLQTAVSVKQRWNDDILIRKGYIKKKGKCLYIGDVMVSDHIRDAVRHALHYATFRKGD